MAMEYFCCYHSYRKTLQRLSDSEVGRLFRSLLEYSETGEAQELNGREQIAFDFIAADIDRAKGNYESRCEKNRNNVLQRYTTVNDGIRSYTKATKEKEKAKEKEIVVDYTRDARETDDEKEILQFCEDVLGEKLSKTDRKTILSACEGMDVDAVTDAIAVAYEHGANTPDYIAKTIRTQREKPERKPGKIV